MTAAVKVTRALPNKWAVTCATCSTSDMFAFFSPPWVVATTQDVAMTLAAWHVQLHREERCSLCQHVPALPKPQVVERNLFRFRGRLFAVTATGVRVMEPA